MLAALTAMMIAAPPAGNAADCVLSAIPKAERARLGEAVLEMRGQEVSSNAALLKATDDCARRYRLSEASAFNASGYAGLHLAGRSLARRLGHPEWAGYATAALRERSPAQRRALAEDGAGEAELDLVVGSMIGQDPSVAEMMKAPDDERRETFVRMVKLFAVAEVARDLVGNP